MNPIFGTDSKPEFHFILKLFHIFGFRYVSEELVQVSRQMVSGRLFYVTMNMATSTCENTDENDDKDVKDCPVDPSGKKLTCKFRILSRPWHPRENLRLLVKGILCDERQ